MATIEEQEDTFLTNAPAIKEAAQAVYACKPRYIYAFNDEDEEDEDDEDNEKGGVHDADYDLNNVGMNMVTEETFVLAVHNKDKEPGAGTAPSGIGIATPPPDNEGKVVMLTPAQVTHVTKALCSPKNRWVYYQGVYPSAWDGVECAFCQRGRDVFGDVMTWCTQCNHAACSFCTMKMRYPESIEESESESEEEPDKFEEESEKKFEYVQPTRRVVFCGAQREHLALCAVHRDTAHIAKPTVGLLTPGRICDGCGKDLGWGSTWWMTSQMQADTDVLYDFCLECAEHSVPDPTMKLVTSSPSGINEFVGLGVLADWVVVARYVPEEIDDDNRDRDECGVMDVTEHERFTEVLVFVKQDEDYAAANLNPELRTLILVRDKLARIGIMGLPLQLQPVLEALASGTIMSTLSSFGFDVYFDTI